MDPATSAALEDAGQSQTGTALASMTHAAPEPPRSMTPQLFSDPASRSALDYAGTFLGGGLHDVAKKAGLKTPGWSDQIAAFLKNPDLEAAIGIGIPADKARAIIEGHAAGKTWRQIAQEIGSNENAVGKYGRRRGLSQPVREPDQQKLQTVLDMRKAGATYDQIAAKLGTTRNVVAGLLGRNKPIELQARQQPSLPKVNLPEADEDDYQFALRWLKGEP